MAGSCHATLTPAARRLTFQGPWGSSSRNPESEATTKRRPEPATIYVASAALLAVLTWVDYATGYELELFALYILPVGLVAWYGTRRAALLYAFAAAACWYTSDRLAGHPYPNALLVYWETFMRLIAYVSTAVSLSAIRDHVRRREELLHAVSHDLRAPLGAIGGQAHVLRARAGDAFTAARAEAILRSARRMEGMIDDLVDGARHEAGHLRLDLRPVELRPFVSELLDRMEGALDVGRIDPALPEGAPLVVVADPARLERILVNLLSNALKYSPGEGRVRVEAEARAGRVVVSVTDEGPGIAPEDAPHLFERYYRGKEGRRSEGTGLGLYGARLLVEAHGGRIAFENVAGGGASFRVEFPAA